MSEEGLALKGVGVNNGLVDGCPKVGEADDQEEEGEESRVAQKLNLRSESMGSSGISSFFSSCSSLLLHHQLAPLQPLPTGTSPATLTPSHPKSTLQQGANRNRHTLV